MKIVLGSDHAGFRVRQNLARLLQSMGHEVRQLGAIDENAYDYPNASDSVAGEILSGNAQMGILVCGTGIGVSIRANRHRGIRAAVCCNPTMARLAREHNHANVLCMGARIVSESQAQEIARAFLEEAESQESRHVKRVELLDSGGHRNGEERNATGRAEGEC